MSAYPSPANWPACAGELVVAHQWSLAAYVVEAVASNV
jgi:hypothetical protein